MTMASRLPAAARERAANFIHDNGNDLQRQRFAFHFDAENADQVLNALRAEPLNQGHCAGFHRQSCTLVEIRANHPVNNRKHFAHDFWLGGE